MTGGLVRHLTAQLARRVLSPRPVRPLPATWCATSAVTDCGPAGQRRAKLDQHPIVAEDRSLLGRS
jgi:hypothetical protein